MQYFDLPLPFASYSTELDLILSDSRNKSVTIHTTVLIINESGDVFLIFTPERGR